MDQYSPKEIADIFLDFLTEEGLSQIFKEWLEGRGYTLEEVHMAEE